MKLFNHLCMCPGENAISRPRDLPPGTFSSKSPALLLFYNIEDYERLLTFFSVSVSRRLRFSPKACHQSTSSSSFSFFDCRLAWMLTSAACYNKLVA